MNRPQVLNTKTSTLFLRSIIIVLFSVSHLVSFAQSFDLGSPLAPSALDDEDPLNLVRPMTQGLMHWMETIDQHLETDSPTAIMTSPDLAWSPVNPFFAAFPAGRQPGPLYPHLCQSDQAFRVHFSGGVPNKTKGFKRSARDRA